ncbi:unnamed protein product [Symbiodinium sp. KB8]|nr:unnamed protein product [Symbiodinium sp. KB8]
MRPKRSIFNSAAMIGVMMATLITPAGSYMTEQVLPETNPNPVVLFEIGSTDATHEAVMLGKDVFEPMTWERVTLDDRPRQCEQGIVELMQLQVEDGGTVAVTGPTDDVVFTSLDTDADFKGTCEHHHDADSKMIAVICKEKDETRAVPCRDTPAPVASALRRLHQNLGPHF